MKIQECFAALLLAIEADKGRIERIEALDEFSASVDQFLKTDDLLSGADIFFPNRKLKASLRGNYGPGPSCVARILSSLGVTLNDVLLELLQTEQVKESASVDPVVDVSDHVILYWKKQASGCELHLVVLQATGLVDVHFQLSNK